MKKNSHLRKETLIDILQEVIENFIQEIMGLSLAEGLTPFLDQAESRCTKFILEFTRGTLRLYDQYLLEHKEERRGYEVVKKDVSRTLETLKLSKQEPPLTMYLIQLKTVVIYSSQARNSPDF